MDTGNVITIAIGSRGY